MSRIYQTKLDWWLGLVLAFSVAVLIASAVPLLIGPPAQTLMGLGIGIFCLATAAWIGWIPFNTRYEIDEIELVIRSAGFCWRVPLDSIVEVLPSHNPLSSPACSLDRLRVNHRTWNGRSKYILISPKQKDDFLRDLADAVPGLQIDGERLVRCDRRAAP